MPTPTTCTNGCWPPNGATSAPMAFGVKGFTLSMIETAIEVTEGRVPAAVIAEILAAGREMLEHPVETPAPCAASGRRRWPPISGSC
jgi:hypothetical protein